MMTSIDLLDVIDIVVLGVGKCTLYPLHSLPETSRTYDFLHKPAQELDLVDVGGLHSDELRQNLMKVPWFQSFPLRFIIILSGKYLAVPFGGWSNHTRSCVTIMKVQGRKEDKKIVFSYKTEKCAVSDNMARLKDPVWCLFKQKELSQMKLPYKQ